MTIKTLRFYHEQGLLVPASIDPGTGYRHYEPAQIEKARTITFLRELEFSISEIKALLDGDGNEDVLELLQRHRLALKERIDRLRKAAKSLDQFLAEEKEARTMLQDPNEIREKALEPLLVAAIRMKGRYSDCGTGFAKIARSLGRHLAGKPLLLHHDSEFHEDDADFEACIPIRRQKPVDGISFRELPGCRCVSLIHNGPYDQMGRSYARALEYVKRKGYSVSIPTREVYLKGPGMIFRGNAKNYVTEIQLPIEEA